METIRTYSELIKIPSYIDRYRYLRISDGRYVGDRTFGSYRFLNQAFYHSKEWKRFRDRILIRDNGCDLGIADMPIYGRALIHHINPITPYQLKHEDYTPLFDPENVITVSENTHNAIHYGDESYLPQDPIERTPNDTCPWRI